MSIAKNNYNLLPISEISDNDKPLSFQVWKKSFEVILPEQAYTQYTDYLINWYKNRKGIINDPNIQIKLNFLNLLKQIQIFFTEEEKENWYSGIDIDNEKEVLLAIPYFSRKLKNISLYYLQLREQIKRSKLKYNLTGSNKSVVKQIQDIILQDYTKKEDKIITLPSSLWSHIPQLSAITNNFVVEIEELYDTNSYFDRSVTHAPSAYFSIEDETEKYFLTKGINLSSIDWVYRLGTFTLSALNDSNFQGSVDPGLTSLYIDLAEKYLGSDFLSSLITTSSAKKDFYTIDIFEGNNFFYYPSSPYKSNLIGLPRYKPTPLSATSLQTLGTPGSSLELADTIFVKTKNGIEGAWFRKQILDVANLNMQATIEGNTSTIFRFPYPGFGISAEDIEWTGYSLITDPRFFYLDETTKKGIEQLYWNNSFSLSGIVPLPINSTSIIKNGGYSSEDFNTADKIRIWSIPPQFDSPAYSASVQEAWLYKFLKTSISIASGEDSTIIWPYQKITNPQESVLPNLPQNICLTESLSDISFLFATGSNHLTSADVIYKINNYRDTKDLAIECAWLSAESFYYPEAHTFGPRQKHFSIVCQPGTYTSFVWDSNDKANINTIINGTTTHSPDCKYITTPNATYKDFKLCTCKQVYFTPFGHPGEQFYDNNGLCDFIIEDTGYKPESVFSLSDWRDSAGRNIEESPDACWFKTSQKIGWGNGSWYSGNTESGNTLLLRKGKRYIYYRANTKDEDPEIDKFPELVIRELNLANTFTKNIWINAKKNDEGEWTSTDTPSNMLINSNDLLIYSRAGSTFYNITGTYTAEQEIAENRGSVWTNFDYISLGNTNEIVLSYPFQTFLQPQISEQFPVISTNNILTITQWSISGTSLPLTNFINTPVVTFIPSTTGLYAFSVTAVSATQLGLGTYDASTSGYYIFTNIPLLTVISQTTEIPALSTFNIPIPGFVLSTNLRGWNYITNTESTLKASITGNNIGAKPLWIKSNVDKNFSTNFKTLESWSPALSFIDNYNPILQYEVSDIILKGGEYIEYKRKPQTLFVWNEDIVTNNITNVNQWCKLTHTSNNIPTTFTFKDSLISIPTTEPSTILLQNVVDNELVEIYYNALTPFTWNITAEPQISETIFSSLLSSEAVTSERPWSNLTNQFYPTVASLPAFDSLYSSKELSEYFKPSNLGLLTYTNKDYTFDLTLSSLRETDFYGPPTKRINNRGLTKQAQFSPYTIKLNDNTWLKEPYTTGSLAGTIKKDIFKKYQKFIPYQSNYESNPLSQTGIITPNSSQHPWGGSFNTEWVDTNNRPINFTGEINVSSWTKDQILKNTTLQLDNWCSDLYGNQYGLYKNIKNKTPSERRVTPGQIWIRKNSQQTQPGYTALFDVFDTFKSLNVYNQLTGFGVQRIDMFYDTLLVETSEAIIFEKLSYDYSNAGIFSIADTSRSISLAVPTQNNLNREFSKNLPTNLQYAKAGDTWFFAREKIIYIAVLELQNNKPIPSLYSLDLNKNNLIKAFTISSENTTFDNFNITEITPPTLSYCSTKKEFLYSFVAKTINQENVIVTISINNTPTLAVNNIKIFTPQPQETLPPVILTPLNITLPVSSSISLQITTIPDNSVFEAINFPDWANLTNTGLFTCLTPTTNQTINLPFKVSNSAGPTYSSLNISVV